MPNPNRRYVSLDEAANYLSVSVFTVRRRIASGEITGYRIGRSRAIRVDLNELDAMMRPIPTAGGDVA